MSPGLGQKVVDGSREEAGEQRKRVPSPPLPLQSPPPQVRFLTSGPDSWQPWPPGSHGGKACRVGVVSADFPSLHPYTMCTPLFSLAPPNPFSGLTLCKEKKPSPSLTAPSPNIFTLRLSCLTYEKKTCAVLFSSPHRGGSCHLPSLVPPRTRGPFVMLAGKNVRLYIPVLSSKSCVSLRYECE